MQGPRLASHRPSVDYNTFIRSADAITPQEEEEEEADVLKRTTTPITGESQPGLPTEEGSWREKWKARFKTVQLVCKRHAAFLGPGLVAAVVRRILVCELEIS